MRRPMTPERLKEVMRTLATGPPPLEQFNLVKELGDEVLRLWDELGKVKRG